MRYARADGMVARRVAGETVLVATGPGQAAAGSAFFVLNETAAALWDALSEPRTLDELARLLTAQFEITYDRAADDIRVFIDELRRQAAVTEQAE